MDFMRNNFIFAVCVCAALLCFWTGCATGPVVGGNEEIGRLRYAYNELEERYNRLSDDYRQFIERQREIAAAQQAATNRIGDGILELEKRTRSVSESVDGISTNNSEAVRLIQRYIDIITEQGQKIGSPEGKEPDIPVMGDNCNSSGDNTLDNKIAGPED